VSAGAEQRDEVVPLLSLKTKTEPTQTKAPYIQDGGYKNERISYAWEVSNHDKDFILLLNSENGAWSETTKSGIRYWRDGKYYEDSGICQISTYYHPEITNHKQFPDYKFQIEQCYKLYKSGTRFYGWEFRHLRGRNLIFPQ